MKTRIFMLVLAVMLMSVLIAPAAALAAKGGKNAGCATIQDGTILDKAGDPVILGFDEWGYNYQAHLFRGAYSDNGRGDPVYPFPDVNLQMKWNDAWLSNKGCDENDKLDRHYGYDTYIGSGAWLTNHDTGVNEDGSTWTYFVKIIAVPADATLVAGFWYTPDDIEIGPVIWGQFAVIQQIITGDIPQDFIDEDLPFPGNYKSPAGAGFGKWK